ncbi:alpha/beta fold hydrolase [Streptomyces aurantiogriseus]|uniref:Hydrolase n=1 Tax=Streptomyces aurantiogriseus TaxID=66870 RepID=A0A918FC62_9ACTN|nr:alpha/beta hydrolase [Streptomyces aurantiogriseus]GGR26108.1 hydrolase [Streptomyces aurantiogriseus]
MNGPGEHAQTLSSPTSDGSLAYREHGAGPALVLLHGGFLDHRMWDDQIQAFASHHRVIAPDARGHGASSNASRPFRPADDVAALLHHLDAAPAVLVGVSMGGGTAIDTALEHPELVRAVVVTGVGTSEPSWEDPWVLDVLAEEQRTLATGDIEAWLNAFLRYAAGPHRPLDDVDQNVVRRLRAMALRTISKHTAGEPDHLVPVKDTWKRAAHIDVPVLAINGGIDSADHIGMAERLVRTVPDGRATTVENTAHYPNMEDPAGYNTLLARFLQTLPGREASPHRAARQS